MPPFYREGDKRYCGAEGISSATKTFINNVKPCLEGDIDVHGLMGALIQQYGKGNIYIEGLKAIVGPGDKASPDSLGGILHPFSPTDPAEGSPNVFAYAGAAGGGLGNILGGNLNIGELVRIGGQLMGVVKNFTNMGGGQGQVVLQNMGGSTPQAGQTLVGDDSGNSLVLTSFERSNAYDLANTAPDYTPVLNVAITDDNGVIALDEYFTGKPSQDYNTDNIVVNDG